MTCFVVPLCRRPLGGVLGGARARSFQSSNPHEGCRCEYRRQRSRLKLDVLLSPPSALDVRPQVGCRGVNLMLACRSLSLNRGRGSQLLKALSFLMIICLWTPLLCRHMYSCRSAVWADSYYCADSFGCLSLYLCPILGNLMPCSVAIPLPHPSVEPADPFCLALDLQAQLLTTVE